MATLQEEQMFLGENFPKLWRLHLGSDWLLPSRCSWPFWWSPCGPIRLAGFTFCQTRVCEAQGKLAGFQEVSTAVTGLRCCCIISEESWQRLTCVSRLTGRTPVCINNIIPQVRKQLEEVNKSALLLQWKKGATGGRVPLWSSASCRRREGATHRSSKCQ